MSRTRTGIASLASLRRAGLTSHAPRDQAAQPGATSASSGKETPVAWDEHALAAAHRLQCGMRKGAPSRIST